MPKQSTDSAGWRAKLEQLAESQGTAQRALESAQSKATAVAFEGGDVTAAAKLVQVHRDTLAALEGAAKEAQNRLEQAEAQEAEAAAQIERGKAQDALRARTDAAAKVDAALVQLGQAHSAFEDAGKLAVAHYREAGDEAPSRLRHGQPDALHGALMHFAPSFHAALRSPRAGPGNRRPLAETAELMAGGEVAAE